MIQLIALDMDGTLLNDQKELAPRQIEAIHKAVDAGVKIVLCTGRPLIGVKPFIQQLGFDQEEEYIIVNNGCSTHSTKDWSLLDWEELKPEDIIYLASFLEGSSMQLSLFDQDHYYILEEKANEFARADANLVYTEPVTISLEEASSGKQPIFEAMFIGSKEDTDRFEARHNSLLSQTFSTVRSQDVLLEILPEGASKASGLKKLAEKLNIQPDHIMAMGDANNDLEMLEFAGLAVAMGNANEAVKAIADDVTTSNNHDGVAKAIEKYILNQ